MKEKTRAGTQAATVGLEKRGRNGESLEVKRAGSHGKVNVGIQKRTHKKITKCKYLGRKLSYEGVDKHQLNLAIFLRGNLGLGWVSALLFLTSQNFLNPLLAPFIYYLY